MQHSPISTFFWAGAASLLYATHALAQANNGLVGFEPDKPLPKEPLVDPNVLLVGAVVTVGLVAGYLGTRSEKAKDAPDLDPADFDEPEHTDPVISLKQLNENEEVSVTSDGLKPPMHHTPLAGLYKEDPSFSMPAFIEFVDTLINRVLTSTSEGAEPFNEQARGMLATSAAESLWNSLQGGGAISKAIFGGTEVKETKVQGEMRHVSMQVTFLSLEGENWKHRQQIWTLRRRTNVQSPPPERLVTLTCPRCGNGDPPDESGECIGCRVIRVGGEIQWEVCEIDIGSGQDTSLDHIPVQPNWRKDIPMLGDSDVAAQKRALHKMMPSLDWQQITDRAHEVFAHVMDARKSGHFHTLREYATLSLMQRELQHHTLIETQGLTRRIDHVELQGLVDGRVVLDGHMAQVTFGVMARYRESLWRGDELVRGDPDETINLREYWTFIGERQGKEFRLWTISDPVVPDDEPMKSVSKEE